MSDFELELDECAVAPRAALPATIAAVPKPTANAVQHGGDHYKSKSIQPWDYIAANELGYFEGNVVKYVSRWRDKGGLEDLHKAQHYLQKLIEVEIAAKEPTL